MSRCCYCKRTFGRAPGIKPGEFTDGICARCWPEVSRSLGLALRAYPGTMTEETVEKKPRVKLVGQDGNAFVVLGLCIRAAKKAKWTPEQIENFRAKATSGDYDNLLRTAMDFFEVR